MAMFRCNGGSGAKEITIYVHAVGSGANGCSIVKNEDHKWKKLTVESIGGNAISSITCNGVSLSVGKEIDVSESTSIRVDANALSKSYSGVGAWCWFRLLQ